jgi:hypothetical protein
MTSATASEFRSIIIMWELPFDRAREHRYLG